MWASVNDLCRKCFKSQVDSSGFNSFLSFVAAFILLIFVCIVYHHNMSDTLEISGSRVFCLLYTLARDKVKDIMSDG